MCNTWPEQDAIDIWFKGHGIEMKQSYMMALKKAVTEPRLKVQDKVEQLQAQAEKDKAEIERLRGALNEAADFIENTSWDYNFNDCDKPKKHRAIAKGEQK